MKKIRNWILPALGALLVLAGCGDQTEERVLTVELPGGAASASFTGTVRDNIRYGKPNAADAPCILKWTAASTKPPEAS